MHENEYTGPSRRKERKEMALAIEGNNIQNNKIAEVAKSLPGVIVKLNGRLYVDLSEDESTDVVRAKMTMRKNRGRKRGIETILRKWEVRVDVVDQDRMDEYIEMGKEKDHLTEEEVREQIENDPFVRTKVHKMFDERDEAEEFFLDQVPNHYDRDRCEYEFRDEAVMV